MNVRLLHRTVLPAILLFAAANTAAAAPLFHLTDLGTLPGGYISGAGGINDLGEVAGHSGGALGFRATLWSGTATALDLGILPGTTSSYANSINNASAVVGTSYSNSGPDRAFLWTSDTGMQDLGTLGGSASRATGINGASHVVGASSLPSGQIHAFEWTSGGGMHDLGTLPGDSSSSAAAINLSGQIVGDSTGTGYAHAVRWTSSGAIQDLGTLGGYYGESHALAISDNGQVVGYSTLGPDDIAFLWTSSGGMQSLGTIPGSDYSFARGVNNNGDVVGDNNLNGFLWTSADGMHALNDLVDSSGAGWNIRYAAGINNDRQIVAVASSLSGQHAVLLTPVPEPSALVLLASAGAGLLIFGRTGKHRRDARFRLGRSLALVALPVAVAAVGASTARAAIKTYAFNGTYTTDGGAPLSDVLSGVEPGDPFSGTVSFDSAAPGSFSIAGQPLSISLELGHSHILNAGGATFHGQTAFFDPVEYPDTLAVTVLSFGAPEPNFITDANVFVSSVFLDVYAAYGSAAPTTLAELDLASPIFTRQYLTMTLHGPSQYPGNFGEQTEVTFSSEIDGFWAVPEPSTLVLLGCAGVGLLLVGRSSKRRAHRSGLRIGRGLAVGAMAGVIAAVGTSTARAAILSYEFSGVFYADVSVILPNLHPGDPFGTALERCEAPPDGDGIGGQPWSGRTGRLADAAGCDGGATLSNERGCLTSPALRRR